MAAFASLFHFCVILLLCARPSFAIFSTSGPKQALSVEEGADIFVSLNNLLAYANGFDPSKWYSSGFSFARVEEINGKHIAFRYIRFSQYCSIGSWEFARGDLVVEDFRTTVPFLRPFLLQGCSWAAVSNGYAWIDYYLLDEKESPLKLPSSKSQTINVSYSNPKTSTFQSSSFSSYSSSMVFLPTVSRYSSPVEKTGYVNCPISPLVLLSHNNGIWDVLNAGEHLTSVNKMLQLVMQRDCNLVLTDTQYNETVWSSNSGGHGSRCFLRLQSDGNLVIYNGNQDNPVWATNQGCGHMCVKFSSLIVEDYGSLVVYCSDNGKLDLVWSTNTTVRGQ